MPVLNGWPLLCASLCHGIRKRPAPGGGDRIRTDDRLVANQVLYQLSYAPIWVVPAWKGLPPVRALTHLIKASPDSGLVGLSGFEPLTSRLSGGRSNQLSYRPRAVPRTLESRGAVRG